jgi:hypothetical protein
VTSTLEIAAKLGKCFRSAFGALSLLWVKERVLWGSLRERSRSQSKERERRGLLHTYRPLSLAATQRPLGPGTRAPPLRGPDNGPTCPRWHPGHTTPVEHVASVAQALLVKAPEGCKHTLGAPILRALHTTLTGEDIMARMPTRQIPPQPTRAPEVIPTSSSEQGDGLQYHLTGGGLQYSGVQYLHLCGG